MREKYTPAIRCRPDFDFIYALVDPRIFPWSNIVRDLSPCSTETSIMHMNVWHSRGEMREFLSIEKAEQFDRSGE